MDDATRTEYSETLGYQLFYDLAPLTTEEFARLRDALLDIERERLIDGGMSAEDADVILAIMDDTFAFRAAAKGA